MAGISTRTLQRHAARAETRRLARVAALLAGGLDTVERLASPRAERAWLALSAQCTRIGTTVDDAIRMPVDLTSPVLRDFPSGLLIREYLAVAEGAVHDRSLSAPPLWRRGTWPPPGATPADIDRIRELERQFWLMDAP